MNAPLTSTGKFVKSGGVIIIMEKPDTHALTSNTQNAIWNSINILPYNDKSGWYHAKSVITFNDRSLTWKTVGNDDTGSIYHGNTKCAMHSANKVVHRIWSKEVLIDF